MATMTRAQIVRGVGHFVEERIDSLRSVAFQHQVDVHCDLDDVAVPMRIFAREHVAESRLHASAESHRHVSGQTTTEACRVEVSVQGPDVGALLGGRAAVRRVSI